jgi:hypothetical protein
VLLAEPDCDPTEREREADALLDDGEGETDGVAALSIKLGSTVHALAYVGRYLLVEVLLTLG